MQYGKSSFLATAGRVSPVWLPRTRATHCETQKNHTKIVHCRFDSCLFRANRSALFGTEDLEEGKPAAPAYSSEISEQDNEQALSELEGRARLIKQLTKDIHGEVESQNKFLESMGIEFESLRRSLGGTVERFQKVFDNKSNRTMLYVVVTCVGIFVCLYFLVKK